MAAADPLKAIKDEVTCSICSDLFKDPVITKCGHSFCKQCITQHCKGKVFNKVCPQCRKRCRKKKLRPNRELKNIVDSISQLLSSQRAEKPIEGNGCERHQEPLKLYCKEDQTPVCIVCERSQAHRAHTVVPLEEAVQEYRETIMKHLVVIESTGQKLLLLEGKGWKHFPHSARQEKEHQRLKKLTDKIVTLLKMDIESCSQRFGDLTSQTQPPESEWKGFSSGRKIAMDTELQEHKERKNISKRVSVKQQETTARHIIRICEEAPDPKYGLDHASLDPGVHTISNTRAEVEHKTDVMSRSNSPQDLTSVKAGMHYERKKDNVSPGENVAMQTELQSCEVDVTLDPATVHRRLVLSEDQKSVRWGETWQDLSDNPERFTLSFSVLGSQCFTSGRHYWEVEVGPGGCWAIQVTREHVNRKRRNSFNARKGLWVLTSCHTPPSFCETAKNIGVFLDYTGGEVTFFNAENTTQLLTYSAKFTGKIFPFFRIWGKTSYFKLSPCQR